MNNPLPTQERSPAHSSLSLPDSAVWKWLVPILLVILLPLSLRAVYRDLTMPSFDSGVFLYEGQHWLRGEMPYSQM